MVTGIIFDIQEFAVHDGPGIRITVFLKGCPLSCPWCHNPEGISFEPQIMGEGTNRRIVGRQYTSSELADIINSQADILRFNKGGVTFSGGEPLSQAEFISEVVDRLDKVHVLLDTSGYGDKDNFRNLIMKCDLIYYDLKFIDRKKHQKYTGSDNTIILDNLKTLNRLKIPFVTRIPLVPGITDTDDNLMAIAQKIKKMPSLVRVDLLTYNTAAGGKYKAIGMNYIMKSLESVRPNINRSIFQDYGIMVNVI